MDRPHRERVVHILAPLRVNAEYKVGVSQVPSPTHLIRVNLPGAPLQIVRKFWAGLVGEQRVEMRKVNRQRVRGLTRAAP